MPPGIARRSSAPATPAASRGASWGRRRGAERSPLAPLLVGRRGGRASAARQQAGEELPRHAAAEHGARLGPAAAGRVDRPAQRLGHLRNPPGPARRAGSALSAPRSAGRSPLGGAGQALRWRQVGGHGAHLLQGAELATTTASPTGGQSTPRPCRRNLVAKGAGSGPSAGVRPACSILASVAGEGDVHRHDDLAGLRLADLLEAQVARSVQHQGRAPVAPMSRRRPTRAFRLFQIAGTSPRMAVTGIGAGSCPRRSDGPGSPGRRMQPCLGDRDPGAGQLELAVAGSIQPMALAQFDRKPAQRTQGVGASPNGANACSIASLSSRKRACDASTRSTPGTWPWPAPRPCRRSCRAGAVAFDIEDVVADLEGQAQRAGVASSDFIARDRRRR